MFGGLSLRFESALRSDAGFADHDVLTDVSDAVIMLASTATQSIWRIMMSVIELLQQVQFLVDAKGNKKAVVLDYTAWDELLTELEDIEDAKEIQHLRELGEEAIPWEQVKAELRAEREDV